MGEMGTRVLRCLAALLIVNSHLELLYGSRLLAGDGLLGNALFFLLSGYGLVAAERVRQRRWRDWLTRRALKIYPALWLVLLVSWILWGLPESARTIVGVIATFVWPTPYAFLSQILIYYPLLYAVIRLRNPSLFGRIAWALVPAYLLVALFDPSPDRIHHLHGIYYFQLVLLGGALAARGTGTTSGDPTLQPGTGRIDLVVLSGLAIGYLGAKAVIASGLADRFIGAPGAVSMAAPLLYHALVALMLPRMVRLAGSPAVVGWFSDPRALRTRLMSVIAGMTLEIYLVHELVLHGRAISELPAPMGWLAFWPSMLLASWLLARTTRALTTTLPRLVGQTTGRRPATAPNVPSHQPLLR